MVMSIKTVCLSKERGFVRRASLIALSIFVLLCMSAGSSSAATYGKIDSIYGVPSLSGENNAYRIEMVTPSQNSLVLTATAAATAADSTGTKLRWNITAEPGTVGTAIITAPPSGVSSLDTSNQSVCSVSFSNTTTADKFTITAQIEDPSGTKIGTSAIVKVSFKAQVKLTGITLDRTSLTVRSGGRPAYLRALPSPLNATGVTYTWSSKSPAAVTITHMAPLSPDMALVRGAYPGYSSTVQVQADSFGSTPFTATCEVTVADKGEVADDMAVPALRGSADEISYMRFYAVDGAFVKDSYTLDDAKIKSASGVSGSVRYILTSNDISPMPMLNNDRANIMSALGVANYATTTAAASRIDLNFMPPMARGDMVPFILALKLDNLVLPDGRTAVSGTMSQQAFTGNFRLIKYFESGSKNYNIDLSRIMLTKSPSGYTKTVNGKTQIVPLIVFVDAPAPLTGCDMTVGDQNQFGVKYDKNAEILFIYDGYADTRITDPMVLEYRAPNIGGGGGGGCNAGAAGFFAIAAAAVLRRRRMK